MPFFAKFWSTKQSNSLTEGVNATPKPEPYKHIPIHAARDARLQVPPSARESDREAIAEHHKRRSQMPQQDSPVLRVNTSGTVDNWSVGQRDIPYVSKEKQAPTAQRPTTALKELHHVNARRKTRSSRRAALIEPTADVYYHLGLPPSPLSQSESSDAKDPDAPCIFLPTRMQLPMPEVDEIVQGEYPSREHHDEKESAMDSSGVATRSNSSSGSSVSTKSKSRVSSTSSQEPLYPPPSRSRARDSLSGKISQDLRSHNPKSSPEKRLRAAAHDSTGIEQAMASLESFRPHRTPPAIVRNDSAYPALPMAGFDFGTEHSYSPNRLRPWLTKTKHNAFQEMPSVEAI